MARVIWFVVAVIAANVVCDYAGWPRWIAIGLMFVCIKEWQQR